jgi:hypothetical protein
MAYPTVSAPYGFKPINRFDGIPYAGATLQFPITAAYGSAIYNGDTVKIVSGGTIELSGAASTGTIIGVLTGVQYTNSSGQTVQAQYYPGSSVTNAIAYVVVDPTAEFKVAVTNSGTAGTVTYVNSTIIGCNVAEVYGTGSTTTGDSGSSIVAPTTGATASTLPWKVVGVVPETAYYVSTTLVYPEVIVKINAPQLTAAAGTSYTA